MNFPELLSGPGASLDIAIDGSLEVREGGAQDGGADADADAGRNGQFPPVICEYEPDEYGRITKAHILDVVCGRGRPYQLHPGNIRLLNIVDAMRDEYSSSRRKSRIAVAAEVLKVVKTLNVDRPIRFLAAAGGGCDGEEHCWREVSYAKQIDKVAHALRAKPRGAARVKKQNRRLQAALGNLPEDDTIDNATALAETLAEDIEPQTATETTTAPTAPSRLDISQAIAMVEQQMAEQRRSLARQQSNLGSLPAPTLAPTASVQAPSFGTNSQAFPSAFSTREDLMRQLNAVLAAENMALRQQLETARLSNWGHPLAAVTAPTMTLTMGNLNGLLPMGQLNNSTAQSPMGTMGPMFAPQFMF